MNEQALLVAIEQMMDRKLEPINNRLDGIDSRLNGVEGRLERIEEDPRSPEKLPIPF